MPNTFARSAAVNRSIDLIVVRDVSAPTWAQELAATSAQTFTLITRTVDNAADLSPAEVERQTFEGYASIASELANSPRRHPVRFWNHVPFITDPADVGRDNYMVFNAGRFRAFSDWYGGTARFERDVATASAIGHWGRDLVIHCLATDAAGTAVNNPRQVAPYHYSQRFGPLPPCFARATRLAHPPHMLLVGGTASVRGEDSVHVEDVPAQLSETFTNLASLVGAAINDKPTTTSKQVRCLAAFRELRVYFPDPADRAEIERAVASNFPNLRRLELLHADLCRAELMVEIEGVADLSGLGEK